MAVYQDRDSRPPEQPLGPSREEMISTLTATA
jgi:hypothetical protein